MTCQGIRKDAQECQATPPRGEMFCMWHDPEREAERLLVQVRSSTRIAEDALRAARFALSNPDGLADGEFRKMKEVEAHMVMLLEALGQPHS